MHFTEALFAYVLANLDEDLSSLAAPEPNPLPCDRWIARSALQKAVRRGEVEIAQRALATLFADDPRSVWRHLVTIALEDLGVAGIDVVSHVIAAGRDRAWRKSAGGEWFVASALVAQMAETPHCQAACDLLLRATNDPRLGAARMSALDAEASELARQLGDERSPIGPRAVAALALGGGLAEGQRLHEPGAVFAILYEQPASSHLVATCEAAWRISRNAMALLLPLLWPAWLEVEPADVKDDALPASTMIGDVPAYALDQFTRVGLGAFRLAITRSTELRTFLVSTGLSAAKWPRVVGDLVFLREGGLMRRRAIWPVGDQLRLPVRSMPNLPLGTAEIAEGLAILEVKAGLIQECRAASIPTVSPLQGRHEPS